MKIIIGLGNIGEKYLRNRHNTGFIAVDVLCEQLEKEGVEIKWKEESKLKALIAKIKYNGQSALLAKPTTLMNNSGQAVQAILQFYKENIENLVIVYDDIDLPLGKIRRRTEGSAGTHNGMRSIIQELLTQNFTRIRIGIESRGGTSPKEQDLHSFVLSNFLDEELPLLKNGVLEAVGELKSILA